MLKLNANSKDAIYTQIVQQIIEYILLGVFEADQLIPSVRCLSKDLGINPNTVQKAYRELEEMGYLYFIPGKGSYVANASQLGQSMRADKMAELSLLIRSMLRIGMRPEDIRSTVENSIKENKQ